MLPNHNKQIYQKIKNNKIFLWIHDLTEKYVFYHDYNEVERICFENDNYTKILEVFYDNKNINFIFVSNFIKELYVKYFNNYGYDIEDNRLNVIYNILYENEFKETKHKPVIFKNENNNNVMNNTIIQINNTITQINNTITQTNNPIIQINNTITQTDNPIVINLNYITYASAWKKGITDIVKVFDYVLKVDSSLILVLMIPCYDWDNYKIYAEELKEKYQNNIIIHGPTNKQKYCEIIKQSMVTLSSTFSETFGCVFAESYYLGTPVIADYRSGGVREIIGDDFIVNYDNEIETVNKILNIKKNRSNMIVTLDDKFLIDDCMKKWLKILG